MVFFSKSKGLRGLISLALGVLALTLAPPVSVSASAMPMSSPCHHMSASSAHASPAAHKAMHNCCCDHQDGQSCPDDGGCAAACATSCAAASFLFAPSGPAHIHQNGRIPLPTTPWHDSRTARLNTPPPRL